MIPCPVCGSDTQVAETRGRKRRRICRDINCNARLQTVEVDVTLARRLFDSLEGKDE